MTGLALSTLYQYQRKWESEASSIPVAFLSRLPISLTIMSVDMAQSPVSFSIYFAPDIALSQPRILFSIEATQLDEGHVSSNWVE